MQPRRGRGDRNRQDACIPLKDASARRRTPHLTFHQGKLAAKLVTSKGNNNDTLQASTTMQCAALHCTPLLCLALRR